MATSKPRAPRVDIQKVTAYAQQYAEELHVTTLGKAVGRELVKDETVFLVKEADPEKVVAIHRALAALTLRWRHHMIIMGATEQSAIANEHAGMQAALAEIEKDDAVNLVDPKGRKV